jgi:hypothetical protein
MSQVGKTQDESCEVTSMEYEYVNCYYICERTLLVKEQTHFTLFFHLLNSSYKYEAECMQKQYHLLLDLAQK